MTAPTPPPGFVREAAPAGFQREAPAPRSLGSQFARSAGLLTRDVLEGGAGVLGIVADPIGAVGNIALDAIDPRSVEDVIAERQPERFQPLRQSVSQRLDQIGLPKPEYPIEKFVSGVDQALVGAGTGVGAGQALMRGAAPLAEKSAATLGGEFLAASPGLQGTSAGVGGGAYEIAQEAGASPGQAALAAVIGSLIPGGGVGAFKLAQTGAKPLVTPFSPEGTEAAVAQAMRDQIGRAHNLGPSPALDERVMQAVASMRDAQEVVPGITTGAASNDAGLIALENSIKSDPAFGVRIRDNKAAASAAVAAATKPDAQGPEGDVAARFFEREQAARLGAAQAPVTNAERQAATAGAEVTAAEDAARALPREGTRASEDLDAIVRAEMDRLGAEKRALYDLGEAGNTRVDPKTLRETAQQIVDELGPIGDPSDVPPQVRRILGLDPGGSTGVSSRMEAAGMDAAGMPIVRGAVDPQQVTLNDIQKLRVWASTAANDAFRAGKTGRGQALEQLKRATSQIYNDSAQQVPEAADQLRRADEFFRETYAPRFREGVGGKLADSIRRDAPGQNLPSQTARKFLGTKEGAADLRRIAAGPDAEDAVRRYLVSDLSEQLGAGGVTQAKIDRWLINNKDVLDQYPAARQEIAALRNRLGTATTNRTAAETALDEARTGFKNAEQADKDLASTRYFIGRDPIKAVEGVMSSGNPGKNMRDLVNEARKDPEALAGLKRSVQRWSDQQFKNFSPNAGEETATSYDRLSKALDRPQMRAALEAVFSPDEMRSLDAARKQLAIISRSDFKATVDSGTAINTQQKGAADDILIQSIGRLALGGPVTTGLSFITKRFGNDPQLAAKELLRKALLDPDLARTLLLRPTEKNRESISRALEAFEASALQSTVAAAQ